MTAPTGATRPALPPEIRQVARGSVVNLVTMVLGAILTFGLTVLVSRWLQPRNAGGFFELIAISTILSNTLQLGADTGLTRWISRARAIGGVAHARKVIVIALVPVAIAGTAAATAVWMLAPAIARIFLHGMVTTQAVADIRIIAPLVPLGALSASVLGGTRGFGRNWPYLAIEGLGKPALRAFLVLAALSAGWGLRGAIVGWAIPVVLGLAAGWLILAKLVREEAQGPARLRVAPKVRFTRVRQRLLADTRAAGRKLAGAGRPASRNPGRHRGVPSGASAARERLGAQFWRFTAPRGFAGSFQILVVWLDVLLVGALLSRNAAGVYAAVSKLALLGGFALEATRLAIGPQLSQFLARRENDRAAALHHSATRWLMVASFPLYIVVSIFPAVALSIFGHRYTAGATALTVLALAMLVNLGTGNVTVVLLMGGKSSLSAYNSLAALGLNVGLNLLLLPRIGIVGAAIAWAASIVVENIAALVEVWLTLDIRPCGTGYWLMAAACAGCFGSIGLAARALLGETLPAAALAVTVGLAIFAVTLYVARARLGLAGLATVLRPAASRATGSRSNQQIA